MSKRFAKRPKNNSLITKFFEKGDPSEIKPDEEIKTNSVVEFYEDCVQSAIVQTCADESCEEKKEELRQRLAIAKSKFEQLNRAVAVAQSICDEKDVEIANLQRQLKTLQCPITTENKPPLQGDCTQLVAQDVQFGRFNAEFSEEQMNQIKSIGESKLEDSKFVLDITRALYSDNIEKLRHVSVTGRSKDGSKQPISPKKMNTLKSMFTERLNGIQQKQESKTQTKTEIDISDRMKTLNQLLNRAIFNLNTTTKNKSNNEEINAKINAKLESVSNKE